MKIAFTLLIAVFASISCLAETERGLASFYSDSLDGGKTASGELYDKDAFTAAHQALDFGTAVRVTYPKTGKSVLVRINDRGPFVENRIIDLSGAAANEIGLTQDGVGEVELSVQK